MKSQFSSFSSKVKKEDPICSFCDGTGEYYEANCPACHGKGTINMDEDEDDENDLYDFLNDNNE
jgi:DnaJ-class molecular chaperone